MKKIFMLFIKDGSDKMTLEDLIRVADQLGETMNDNLIVEMFERADTRK